MIVYYNNRLDLNRVQVRTKEKNQKRPENSSRCKPGFTDVQYRASEYTLIQGHLQRIFK